MCAASNLTVFQGYAPTAPASSYLAVGHFAPVAVPHTRTGRWELHCLGNTAAVPKAANRPRRSVKFANSPLVILFPPPASSSYRPRIAVRAGREKFDTSVGNSADRANTTFASESETVLIRVSDDKPVSI